MTTSKHIDFDDGSDSKADFYTILRRRKRTVKDFISFEKINSIKELKNIIKQLEKQYLVSVCFVEEATTAIQEKEKPVVKKAPVEKTKTPTVSKKKPGSKKSKQKKST